MPANHSHLDLLEANAYVRKASESFFWQCTTRTDLVPAAGRFLRARH